MSEPDQRLLKTEYLMNLRSPLNAQWEEWFKTAQTWTDGSDKRLLYMLYHAFIGGWNARSGVARDQIIKTFDKMLGEEEP